jgi:hypothetical protein
MDRPPPDPAKLLQTWMEWERGELPPGRVMASLKTGGLRDLLEEWVAVAPAGSGPIESGPIESGPIESGPDADTESSSAADTWKPVV